MDAFDRVSRNHEREMTKFEGLIWDGAMTKFLKLVEHMPDGCDAHAVETLTMLRVAVMQSLGIPEARFLELAKKMFRRVRRESQEDPLFTRKGEPVDPEETP